MPSIPLDVDTYCLLIAVAYGEVAAHDAAMWLYLSVPSVMEWEREAIRHAKRLISEADR